MSDAFPPNLFDSAIFNVRTRQRFHNHAQRE